MKYEMFSSKPSVEEEFRSSKIYRSLIFHFTIILSTLHKMDLKLELFLLMLVMYSISNSNNVTQNYYENLFGALEIWLSDVDKVSKRIENHFKNLRNKEVLSAATVVIPTMMKLWPYHTCKFKYSQLNEKE